MPPVNLSSTFSSPPDSGRIRCVCEYDEDDGFTIQCEQCLVWQHAKCVGISKSSVPEQYFCEECNPTWHEDLHNLALRAINLDVINNATHTANVNIIEDSGNSTTSIPNSYSSSRAFKRKIHVPPGVPALNEISENIISNDAQSLIESFLKGLNVPRLKRQQHAQDPNLINFEFHSTVVMDTSEHLALLQKNLEVREIRNRGYQKKGSSTKFGLFALEFCDPGHFVCEFIGHVQLKQLLTVKGAKEYPVSVPQSFVLYPLASIDLAVDARKFGNNVRYVRRSCRPNVQIKPIIVENENGEFSLSWGLFARNVIKANSEIFLPLDYQCGNGLFRYECACNAPEFCLGPLDNFSTPAPALSSVKDGEIAQRPASPKPVSVVAASVESAELEALGIRRSSSTVLQDSQAAPPSMTRPILDTRKLSREERKLQKYIEYFEKMDQTDAAKKVTSSNSSIGSRKGSSSGSSPQSSSNRAFSPEKASNGGLKKAWKKLFSSNEETEEAPGHIGIKSLDNDEAPVAAKKRGRKPSVKTSTSANSINDDAVTISESSSFPELPIAPSSPNPSSPLKPKASPKRKKTQSAADVAIVEESSSEEIDVDSEPAGKIDIVSTTTRGAKKTKIEKSSGKKAKRDEKKKDSKDKDDSENEFEPQIRSQTPAPLPSDLQTQMPVQAISPIIDIERSSSVVNLEPTPTAPDTPSKKKLSLSDYLKKKKASPVGVVSLNFDENEEGEISDTEKGDHDVIESSGFLSEPVVPIETGQIREFLRQSISSVTGSQSFEDIGDRREQRGDLRDSRDSFRDSSRESVSSRDHWYSREQQQRADYRDHSRDSRDRRHPTNPPSITSQPQSASRYKDEREKEFDRLQREREFERREAERERERRERMDREFSLSQASSQSQNQTQYSQFSSSQRFNRPNSPPHYRPSFRPHRPHPSHYNRPPPPFNNRNYNDPVNSDNPTSSSGYRPPNYRNSNSNSSSSHKSHNNKY